MRYKAQSRRRYTLSTIAFQETQIRAVATHTFCGQSRALLSLWPCGSSTGIAIQSEQIRQVEYHPCGSLWINGLIEGSAAVRDTDFLYVRTSAGATHVSGTGASQDVDAIEQAGVRVYRRPNLTQNTAEQLSGRSLQIKVYDPLGRCPWQDACQTP